MSKIVLITDKLHNKNSLISTVHRALKNYGGYTLLSENNKKNTIFSGKRYLKPKFELCELSCKKSNIKINGNILIVDEKIGSNNTIDFSTSTTTPTIISEACAGAINLFKFTEIPVIGCGMGTHNTLSISSINYRRSMVALQRSIKTLDGKIIDPIEFFVELSTPTGIYPILATCAILLLSGIVSDNGYTF